MSRQAPLELLEDEQRLVFNADAYRENLLGRGFSARRATMQTKLVASAFADAKNPDDLEERLVSAGINAATAHGQAEGLHAFLTTPRTVGKRIGSWYNLADANVLANNTEPPTRARGGKAKASTEEKKPASKTNYIQVAEATDYPLLQTKQASRVLEMGYNIRDNMPSNEDFAFTHAIFCQVALPHSRYDGDEFMRKSGPNWISVQSGLIDEGSGPVRQPIPYGPIPRLALVWISSYAVMNRDREVPIGASAAEFLNNMGMGREGRRYKALRQQMHALAACRIQLGMNGRTYNGQPVEQFDAWINNTDSHQRPLWPGVLRLSETYYNSLIESAVPLDNRAMLLLKGSSLKLDIYTWMAHRLHRINSSNGLFMRWSMLREQFGHEYQGPDADKNFKKTFLHALRDVMQAYPAAKIKKVRGGLQFDASPPPIPMRKIRA